MPRSPLSRVSFGSASSRGRPRARRAARFRAVPARPEAVSREPGRPAAGRADARPARPRAAARRPPLRAEVGRLPLPRAQGARRRRHPEPQPAAPARYFPELVEALRRMPGRSFVVDGELVAARGGAFDFEALLGRRHRRRRREAGRPPLHARPSRDAQGQAGEPSCSSSDWSRPTTSSASTRRNPVHRLLDVAHSREEALAK